MTFESGGQLSSQDKYCLRFTTSTGTLSSKIILEGVLRHTHLEDTNSGALLAGTLSSQ